MENNSQTDGYIILNKEQPCMEDSILRTFYKCTNCADSEITSWYNFCPNCGIQVVWENEHVDINAE